MNPLLVILPIFLVSLVSGQTTQNVDCSSLHERRHSCMEPFKQRLDALKDTMGVDFQASVNNCFGTQGEQCIQEIQRMDRQRAAARKCRQQMATQFASTRNAVQQCYSQYPNTDAVSSNNNAQVRPGFTNVWNYGQNRGPQNQNQRPAGNQQQETIEGEDVPGGRVKPPVLPRACYPRDQTQTQCMMTENVNNLKKRTDLVTIIREMQQTCQYLRSEGRECRPKNDNLCNCLCIAKQPVQHDFRSCMSAEGVTSPGGNRPQRSCTEGCRQRGGPRQFPFSQAQTGNANYNNRRG